MIKVGDTAEVIEITNNNYPILYENGACGIIDTKYMGGSCSAIVGKTIEEDSGSWHVPNGTYRKVGKLTVKALKHG